MISITIPFVGGANQQSHVPSWKRGVDVASPDVPSGGSGLEPLAVPSGGGFMTVKPWWEQLPSSIPAAISRGLETPTLVPVGAVSKTIFKIGGMAGFAALGGFILGGLFGGGGSQEQDITQQPTVIPTVEPTVIPTIIAPVAPTIDPTVYQTGEGTINQYTTTNTITYNIQPTRTTTLTKTVTVTGASQEAKQEGGTNWGLIAVVVAAALFLPRLLKGKKVF